MNAINVCADIEALALAVENDDADPIEALAELRAVAKALKLAMESVDAVALRAAESYPKNFHHAGLNWTKKDGARRPDYSGVPAIISLKEELEVEQKKAINAFNALERMTGVMHDDGGVYARDGVYIGHPAKMNYSKPSLVIDSK